MNTNDANTFMAMILSEEFRRELIACLDRSAERIAECQNVLPPYLNVSNSNRLFSDLSAACIRLSLLEGAWGEYGLVAREEARGAFFGVRIDGENLRLEVLNSTSFKLKNAPAYIKACVSLNDPSGWQGKRGVFLLYDLNEGKGLDAARLVMRGNAGGQLYSSQVYPARAFAVQAG